MDAIPYFCPASPTGRHVLTRSAFDTRFHVCAFCRQGATPCPHEQNSDLWHTIEGVLKCYVCGEERPLQQP